MKLHKLLIVLFSLGVFFACSSPIGTVDARRGGELLWTVPSRQIYNLEVLGEDRFNRENDLQVFTSIRGLVELVPSGDVEIYIVENPWAEDPEPIPVNGNGNGNGNGNRSGNGNGNGNENGNGNGGAGLYLFETAGRKVVIVNYMNLETHYSIEVLGYGSNGNGGSGSGVDIQWYD